MKHYEVKITGKTALLMHWDNIEWADVMAAWKDDPKNSKLSKAGDDRTPARRWIGCLYHDENFVGMPSDNLMRCFMEGGAMVPVPGGRSGKSFKAQTQSGMMVKDSIWVLTINDEPIPYSKIELLNNETDFNKHKDAVIALGFELHVKRAKIGASKHIRVRPMFRKWELKGILTVWDEQITDRVLTDILTSAGEYKGLGDWRPGGKTPGSFGRFDSSIKEI
jgi:hypothetical protein